MKFRHKDFKAVPNKQRDRKQTDLWDVVSGGEVVITISGQAAAQEVVNKLNVDPWHLNRGQTRFERTGTQRSVARSE